MKLKSAGKQVFLSVASHPSQGHVMNFEGIETTANDTGTKVEDWEVHEGWISIEAACAISPLVREAILAGRLKIREVSPEAPGGTT